ncbi:hypothetical protein IFM89_003452, partial [Coptis chinensis]
FTASINSKTRPIKAPRYSLNPTMQPLETANKKFPSLFFQCADLLLPWLSPLDLASSSLTCKFLHQISKQITISRSLDASQNLETHPIPFINNTPDSEPYSYFVYTPCQILQLSNPSQQWGCFNSSIYLKQTVSSLLTIEDGFGCDCEGICSGDECVCCRLKPEFDSEFGFEYEVMSECGERCVCDLSCRNRLTQNGVSVRLRVVKDGRKGWGLHAGEFIRQGEFVCEYAGELLTTAEARCRQQKYDELAASGKCPSALLVVREHLPSGKACLRVNIDATKVGNIARFINHACDGGNLLTVLVRNSGMLFPRLCFFTSRDVLEGEELVFSYGDVRLSPNGLRCYCGSSYCFGFLPSENT